MGIRRCGRQCDHCWMLHCDLNSTMMPIRGMAGVNGRSTHFLQTCHRNAVKHLEPGFEDAFEIIRVARAQVAPVAWGLFTDKTTWDEWLFASNGDEGVIDKGELLASFARKGRCVLLSSEKRSY